MRRGVIAVFVLAALGCPASAQDRTFGGYECTDDCEGHAAGYKWAEEHGIEEESNCPYGNSQSFHEGCMAYTHDNNLDPDSDDDGHAVGEPLLEPDPEDDDDDSDR